MFQAFVLSFLQAGIVSFLIFGLVHASLSVSGEVMTSGSFSIQSDSVNFGGGYSTSSSYTLESTAGEIATGVSFSDTYQLRAGYQQMQEIYLALSVPGELTLSPALPGISAGTSTGLVGVSVITDSPGGYSLALQAQGEPAMQTTDASIADYSPAGAVPDFEFALAPTAAVFGFTPEGDDVALRYLDSGGVCGVVGVDTPERCWDGMSTSSRVVATGIGSNHPTGATTTFRFQVGLGGMIAVPPGMYVATSTVTAIPL